MRNTNISVFIFDSTYFVSADEIKLILTTCNYIKYICKLLMYICNLHMNKNILPQYKIKKL